MFGCYLLGISLLCGCCCWMVMFLCMCLGVAVDDLCLGSLVVGCLC